MDACHKRTAAGKRAFFVNIRIIRNRKNILSVHFRVSRNLTIAESVIGKFPGHEAFRIPFVPCGGVRIDLLGIAQRQIVKSAVLVKHFAEPQANGTSCLHVFGKLQACGTGNILTEIQDINTWLYGKYRFDRITLLYGYRLQCHGAQFSPRSLADRNRCKPDRFVPGVGIPCPIRVVKARIVFGAAENAQRGIRTLFTDPALVADDPHLTPVPIADPQHGIQHIVPEKLNLPPYEQVAERIGFIVSPAVRHLDSQCIFPLVQFGSDRKNTVIAGFCIIGGCGIHQTVRQSETVQIRHMIPDSADIKQRLIYFPVDRKVLPEAVRNLMHGIRGFDPFSAPVFHGAQAERRTTERTRLSRPSFHGHAQVQKIPFRQRISCVKNPLFVPVAPTGMPEHLSLRIGNLGAKSALAVIGSVGTDRPGKIRRPDIRQGLFPHFSAIHIQLLNSDHRFFHPFRFKKCAYNLSANLHFLRAARAENVFLSITSKKKIVNRKQKKSQKFLLFPPVGRKGKNRTV